MVKTNKGSYGVGGIKVNELYNIWNKMAIALGDQ